MSKKLKINSEITEHLSTGKFVESSRRLGAILVIHLITIILRLCEYYIFINKIGISKRFPNWVIINDCKLNINFNH